MPEFVHAAVSTNPLASREIVDIVRTFVEAVIYVGAPVFIVGFMYSGFLFTAALGNPAKLTQAKRLLLLCTFGSIAFFGMWVFVKLIATTAMGLSLAGLLLILLVFLGYTFYVRG